MLGGWDVAEGAEQPLVVEPVDPHERGVLDVGQARNIAPDCVILERRGIFHGREGALELAQLLETELPDAPYVYTNRLIEGRFAFLEWTAEAPRTFVRDGADSFVIEDGWIVAQTIHYTVQVK